MVERILFGPGGATEAKQDSLIGAVLTNDQLLAALLRTTDTFTDGQVLPDQAGANGVLTFTFSAPVDLVWVMSLDTDKVRSGQVRADPFGGTPTATLGIPCLDQSQQPISVITSSVKVYALTGQNVSVWGFRY